MSLVRNTNKKTGVTYVYESESYWDKEKQQARSRRKLVGKIDPETGEIVPTGKRGRKSSQPACGKKTDDDLVHGLQKALADRDQEIRELKAQNRALLKERDAIKSKLAAVLSLLDSEQPICKGSRRS